MNKLETSAYNVLGKAYTVEESDLDGIIAFQLYSTVKLDFTSKTFDFRRDGVPVNFTAEALLKRNDKSQFLHIANKFIYQNRYLALLVINLYKNNKLWVKDLMNKDCIANALTFRKYQNNLYRSFETEIQKLAYQYKIQEKAELYHPIYHTTYFELERRGIIHPVTSAILNSIYYDKSLSWGDNGCEEHHRKLNKLLNYVSDDIDMEKIHKIIDELLK
jgi:hypothetical protein